MRGIIIVNQVIGHNEYKINRFKEEFKKLGVELDVIQNNGTLVYIKDGEITLNIPKVDFYLYLDKDHYLAKLLDRKGLRVFNRPDFIKICDDKLLTFIECCNKGIKMPNTFAGPLVYGSNINPSLDFLDSIIEKLSFPMVIKKVYGSLGEGVYLVKDKEELISLYKEICHSPILFQKYLPYLNQRSVRVLIIDGKVFGGFIRKNETDFRSNFGSTSGSEVLQNSKKYFDFAQNIADLLHIEYAGIDLLDDENNEPILCEINSNAFFEEFEKITKTNVANAYAKMVIRKVKNEQK